VKLYFAGPLFSAAERDWNAALAGRLRAAGHLVFLPQEKEGGKDAAGIFATDVAGIDWSDALVAVMDGPDPDSGTAWECGYAYGKKPVVLVRTDIRASGDPGMPYNAMLTASATIRLDLGIAEMDTVASAVLDALEQVMDRGDASGLDELRDIERSRLRSLVDVDLERAMRLHAPDYQLITPGGGTFTREEYLGVIERGELVYEVFEPASDIAVRRTGDAAAVRYQARIAVRWPGGREEGVYWHTDLYERRDGQWQATWSQATQTSQPGERE
jgi:nucleoside 2-deoxyribosyltransferase